MRVDYLGLQCHDETGLAAYYCLDEEIQELESATYHKNDQLRILVYKHDTFEAVC